MFVVVYIGCVECPWLSSFLIYTSLEPMDVFTVLVEFCTKCDYTYTWGMLSILCLVCPWFVWRCTG